MGLEDLVVVTRLLVLRDQLAASGLPTAGGLVLPGGAGRRAHPRPRRCRRAARRGPRRRGPGRRSRPRPGCRARCPRPRRTGRWAGCSARPSAPGRCRRAARCGSWTVPLPNVRLPTTTARPRSCSAPATTSAALAVPPSTSTTSGVRVSPRPAASQALGAQPVTAGVGHDRRRRRGTRSPSRPPRPAARPGRPVGRGRCPSRAGRCRSSTASRTCLPVALPRRRARRCARRRGVTHRGGDLERSDLLAGQGQGALHAAVLEEQRHRAARPAAQRGGHVGRGAHAAVERPSTAVQHVSDA